MKNKEWIGYATALGAAFFWSFSFVWVKIAYFAYKPITVIFFRLMISAAILFLFSYMAGKLQKPSKKDIRIFLLLAFFEPLLYFMGESFGLLYVSSTVASVIVATIPLISPVVAWYFYKEKLSAMNLVGLVFTFAGVSLVVLNKSLGLVASPKGVLLEFLAVFSAISYTVVLKRLLHRYNTYTIIAYQNFFGVLMFLPFWLFLDMNDFMATPFNTKAFSAILLLAVFASTFAFIFFTYSVRQLGINRSNIFINLIPVFVAVMAYFILDEQLSLQKIAGIGVVIAGLFLAQIKKRAWYNA